MVTIISFVMSAPLAPGSPPMGTGLHCDITRTGNPISSIANWGSRAAGAKDPGSVFSCN